ncbi:MAG: putative quinol monooxygenase [Thermoproteota archaeon]
MYVVCVTVFVKPGKEKDFIEAILENARKTRQEPDNVRFDVLQSEENPSQFFLYEVYKNTEGFKGHQQTEHYLKWKERVADWMAQPRQGMRYFSIFPEDQDW